MIKFFFISLITLYCITNNPQTNIEDQLIQPICLQASNLEKTFISNSYPILISWGIEEVIEDEEKLNSPENLQFYKQIMEILEKGNQIKTIFNQTKNKNILFKELHNKDIQFHISLKIKNGKIIWKLYETIDKKLIKGKSYPYKNISKPLLLRTILIDLWQEFFGEEITPFECFLVFLNTKSSQNNLYYTSINFFHPLIPGFEKQLLKTKNNILDMTVLQSLPLQSILFIMQKNEYMEIIKLNSFGQLSTIYKTKTTLTSPTINKDGLFFIDSQCLFRYYFNKIKNKYIKEKIDTHKDYVSVLAIIDEEKLLASRGKILYEINYQTDKTTNHIIINSAKKITESNIQSLNMTYNPNEKFIVVSQKINFFYQLVIYEKNNKKIILTDTPYHKQDPSMSPCGNYIAYIAQNTIGERRIEIINRYSGKVITAIPESSEYRFPTWIIR